ncbi:Uncharacterized protein HZ326_11349 [Fusarium oxysporum f. sp. albedinis]|nr:Uncharacterized protein HZ326_11349 [Fusarium oxysporum f. sp. albedinis]
MVVQKIARGLEWFVEDVDELSRDISQCSLVGTYEFIMLRTWVSTGCLGRDLGKEEQPTEMDNTRIELAQISAFIIFNTTAGLFHVKAPFSKSELYITS